MPKYFHVVGAKIRDQKCVSYFFTLILYTSTALTVHNSATANDEAASTKACLDCQVAWWAAPEKASPTCM